MERPRIENAPGLQWRQLKVGAEFRWKCRTDIMAKGFQPSSVRLWSGTDITPEEIEFIASQCRRLQTEMLAFSNEVLVLDPTMDGTLGGLIWCYQNDKDSAYHNLRFYTRQNHATLLRRLGDAYGMVRLEDIKARQLIAWHALWADGGKISMAHAFVGELRTVFGFGLTMMEDKECQRLCMIMHKMRFPMSTPRTERMTAEQAIAIRRQAHLMGLHSIAFAQALQFELMLRQKDVIGEWVPVSEKGTSDILYPKWNIKWLRGLRWSEIDENLILRHVTSKRQKLIEVDLKLAPMVTEELGRLSKRPTDGPIIVSEFSALPWCTVEFRRHWRKVANAAGIPKEVRNMDSRAGGITEATDAGAALEDVRHAATHSDIAMTQKYSRGSTDKVAKVMQMRSEHRNKNK